MAVGTRPEFDYPLAARVAPPTFAPLWMALSSKLSRPPPGHQGPLRGSYPSKTPARIKVAFGSKIGIGGHLAAPPLPHHRAYGSVPRRFDRVKRGQERRVGEDRDRRNRGCAGPVGRPDVRTCARNRSASRQQPPRGTSADHAVAVL